WRAGPPPHVRQKGLLPAAGFSPRACSFEIESMIAADSVHLSHWESSDREAIRVRGYGLSRERCPLTPSLSAVRAFTPVFDGLWGRGSRPPVPPRLQLQSNMP